MRLWITSRTAWYHERMIKRCIQAGLVGALLATAFFIPLSTPVYTEAVVGVFVPFGGIITTMTVCNEGLLLYLGPPTPFPVVVPYGPTYLMGVFHPGGWVIGLAAGFSPCTVGPTVVGGGLRVIQAPINFIGTSL